MIVLKPVLCLAVIVVPICAALPESLYSTTAELAHGLHNPRGLIPLANGDLIILEAETGEKLVGQERLVGGVAWIKIGKSIDPPERIFLRKDLYSYNIMEVFNPLFLQHHGGFQS